MTQPWWYTQEVDEGESGIQGYPWPHNKFEEILSYKRLYIKTKKKTKNDSNEEEVKEEGGGGNLLHSTMKCDIPNIQRT